MSLVITLTKNTVQGTLVRYAVEARRSMQQVATRFMAGVTRRVLAITPPGNADTQGSRQTLTKDAYRAGASKIARQMNALMAPRTLKGKRKERHPDVAGLYRAHLRSTGTRVRLSGYTGKVYYVDRRKYQAVLKDRQGRVGRMASGWASAAYAFNVLMPAWVTRHGAARGRVQQEFSGPRIQIRVTNFAPEASGAIRDELRRRIPYAMKYQENGMLREIREGALGAAARAGLKVRRQ